MHTTQDEKDKLEWKLFQKQVSDALERDEENNLQEELKDLSMAERRREYGKVWKIVNN